MIYRHIITGLVLVYTFIYILFVSASLFNLYLFLKGTTRTEAKRKQIKPETKRKHDTVWYVY